MLTSFACSSARMSDRESDRLFREGRYNEAATRLKKGYEDEGESGRDSLLFLLDLGLALHSQGKFEESNRVFQKADKLAEIKDYTSLSKEAATLLVSENLKDYKAEDFENIMISTFLAMNYALVGDNENALVEARRVNHKLYLMVTEGKRHYNQNAFARYLSAILYEADYDYDNAYIDYQNTLKLKPSFPGLGRDLWRCAKALHMSDQMEKWDSQFHLTAEDHAQASLIGPPPPRSHQSHKKPMGEIIVLYENGISPLKRPNPEFHSLPKFYPRYNPTRVAQVELNGVHKGTTAVLEDIEATAMQNLDEKYGGMIAKKIAGTAVKGAIGYGLAEKTNSPLLGIFTALLLMSADEADLRSWSLLPRDLQLVRISVEAGTYSVRVKPDYASALPEKTVQVEPAKKVFVHFRFMP